MCVMSVPPAVAGGYCVSKTHPLPQVVLTNLLLYKINLNLLRNDTALDAFL